MAKAEPSWLQEPHHLALAAFGLGLLLAAGAGMMNRASNQRSARVSFDAMAEGTAARLESRMQSYAYGLQGVRGVIMGAGHDQITRDRFHQYAASRTLDQEFPGARGFGYIRRVAAEDEKAFLARVQQENAEFNIRPSGRHSGDRYVIQYLEPEAPNLAAIGFDIATEPNRPM